MLFIKSRGNKEHFRNFINLILEDAVSSFWFDSLTVGKSMFKITIMCNLLPFSGCFRTIFGEIFDNFLGSAWGNLGRFWENSGRFSGKFLIILGRFSFMP